MCRLFGVRAARPVPLYRYLIGGDNSFAVQSLEHPDGWGVAYYDGAAPTVVKSILPAICDERFESTSFEVQAPTVVAHLRRATVGKVAAQNCHPFRRGNWVFAHNGHIHGVDVLRDEVAAHAAADLRDPLEGNTDSELYFALFLTALRQRVPLDHPAPSLDALRGALGWASETILRITGSTIPPGQSTSLTCLASNGEVLVGRCGGLPLSVQVESPGELVLFSSEAIGTKGVRSSLAQWDELADGEVAMVGRDLAVVRGRLG